MNEQTKTQIEQIKIDITETDAIILNRAAEIMKLKELNKADLKHQAIRASTIELLTKLGHD